MSAGRRAGANPGSHTTTCRPASAPEISARSPSSLASAPSADLGPRAAQMTVVMTFADELGERRLLEGRTAGIAERLGGAEGSDQRLGKHEIAEAQCREQHLGERPEVEHATAAVEALERADRRTGTAILAVV